MGVDEIYFGKQMKFITVVSNVESGEPLWFGQDRKQETLDEFFRTQLKENQRKRIEAACVDMWRQFTNSIDQWAPNCRIVYDKFHVLQHANKAIDEVRRAEFFRKGGRMRDIVKGKRWLLLTRWMNLDSQKRRQLNELFALNRRVMKAYLLKESLERLWTYRYERAMLGYLQSWIDQLRWQRLVPFQNLAYMLPDHLDGILNYCPTKVRFGVVEAINANIKTLPQKGAWLQESGLSAAQGSAHGGHQDRIPRSSESRLKCGLVEFLCRAVFLNKERSQRCTPGPRSPRRGELPGRI